MLLGLAVNTVFPLIWIDRPLSTPTLLFAFDALMVILIALDFTYSRESLFETYTFRSLDRSILTSTRTLPILACLGAINLNNGGAGIYTLVALALSIPLLLATLLARRIHP